MKCNALVYIPETGAGDGFKWIIHPSHMYFVEHIIRPVVSDILCYSG